ncbi:MAG: WecB/TagA/CpsF family glycosyltransferase [Armatimonadota bacterium]|nr:WecB/TagA/CpsF family glycosyltransferase [Armatimonadota bacterium]
MLLVGFVAFALGLLLRFWHEMNACWWLPVASTSLFVFFPLVIGVDFKLAAAMAAFVLLAGIASRQEKRWLRELGTATGALIVTLAGLKVDSIKVPFMTHFVSLGAFSIPLTTFWLWLFAALFRPTARLKGLTWSALFLSGLTFFAIVTMMQTHPELAQTLSLVAVGFGLALWNLPAEAGGAASVGALLAMASVAGALKNTAFLIFIAPALALGVPTIEVTYRLRASGFALPTQVRSLFELLTAERVDERRAFWLLTMSHAYLCLLAVLLVWLVEVHFLLKLILMAVWLAIGGLAFWVAMRLSARKEGKGIVNLLGVPVAALTMDEALDILEQFVSERRTHLVVTSDASSIVRAQEDEEFRKIVQNADLVTPDGIGVVWGARLLGLPIYQRVPGVELMAKLCERAAQKGWKVFMLGAKPGVAEQAAKNLQARYPSLQIVGTHHGYFTPEEEPQVIAKIKAAQPDILFVAFGIPKQEKWIARHADELQVPICIGVGGSFDVYAGVVKRAPEWVQRLYLEWLYRTVKDPKRLPRLKAIPKLLWFVFKEAWSRKNS